MRRPARESPRDDEACPPVRSLAIVLFATPARAQSDLDILAATTIGGGFGELVGDAISAAAIQETAEIQAARRHR